MTFDCVMVIIHVPLNSTPKFNGASDNSIFAATVKCHFSHDRQDLYIYFNIERGHIYTK